jgi:hypothetical protein
MNLLIAWNRTESRGRVVSTPASYSGGSGFKYRPLHRLSWLEFFVAVISPCRLQPLPSTSFKIHHSLVTPSFDTIVWVTQMRRSINYEQTIAWNAFVCHVGIDSCMSGISGTSYSGTRMVQWWWGVQASGAVSCSQQSRGQPKCVAIPQLRDAVLRSV